MNANSGRFKSIPVEQRFWGKVDKTKTCWNWMANLDISGYGVIKHDGKNRKAHRISWTMKYGEIPSGVLVCHRCDNPRCVRPSHLFLGSHKDNRDDCVSKKRQAVGEAVTISKLSRAKVIKIRKLFASGVKMFPLAKRFNVTHRSIKLVVRRLTWAHVD